MQQTVTPAVVTPSGVRDGDPAALQGLCERRGASVMAYCLEVCPPDDAARAAAEAFARFRAAVVALDDVTAIDPEALLLSATRHAAASLAVAPPVPRGRRWLRRGQAPQPQGCDETAELLIGRVEGTLSDGEQQWLTSHLEQCQACRALKDMFRHAEVLYRDPGATLVPLVVATAIVDALAAAAPVSDALRREPAPAPAPAVEEALGPERADEAPDVVAESDEQDAGDRPRRRLRRRRRTLEFPAVATEAADEQPEPQLGFAPLDMPPVTPDAEAAMARVFPDPGIARRPPARALPRPPRHPVHPHDHPRHHGRARTVLLPSAIVLAAVASALGIAGVFGGDEGSPPGGAAADDQLFPNAVLRAPARGTAAAAAAEIARLAEIERRRAARARRLREQGASASTTGGAVSLAPPSLPARTGPSATPGAVRGRAAQSQRSGGDVAGPSGPATAR